MCIYVYIHIYFAVGAKIVEWWWALNIFAHASWQWVCHCSGLQPLLACLGSSPAWAACWRVAGSAEGFLMFISWMRVSASPICFAFLARARRENYFSAIVCGVVDELWFFLASGDLAKGIGGCESWWAVTRKVFSLSSEEQYGGCLNQFGFFDEKNVYVFSVRKMVRTAIKWSLVSCSLSEIPGQRCARCNWGAEESLTW